MAYAIVASVPLFMAGAYVVRLQDDLDISKSQFGLAVAAYFLASSIASPSIGRWLDRVGSQLGFRVASIGGACAAVVVASAPSLWVLGAAFGIAGLSNTTGQIASNRVLAANVPEERKALGFGAKQAAVPMGSFVSGMAVLAAGTFVPWRVSFVVLAAIVAGMALVAPALGPPNESQSTTDRSGVARDRSWLIAVMIAGGLGSGTGNGLAVLIVDAFDTAGYRESIAAAVLSFGSLAAIVGRLGVGILVGRSGKNGFGALILILALGAVGFACLAAGEVSAVLLGIGVLFAFSAGWGWPGVIYYVVISNSSGNAGAASGFVLRGVFFGAVIGAPLFAAIAERWSYRISWTVAAGLVAIGAGLVVWAARVVAAREAGTTSAHPQMAQTAKPFEQRGK